MKQEKLPIEGTPFADAAVSGPKRFGEYLGTANPYRKMSDLEGKECLLHSFKLRGHPEFGDAYESQISVVEEGEHLWTVFLRGAAILNQFAEFPPDVPLPVRFRLIKPEGKRYWVME